MGNKIEDANANAGNTRSIKDNEQNQRICGINSRSGLQNPENQKLREFASLTSFPGCKAQCWHRDSTEKDAVLITGFMNLYKTKKENGALQVIKGSHKNIKWLEEIKIDNISTIELPAKSLTFIDSRVIHRGGAIHQPVK